MDVTAGTAITDSGAVTVTGVTDLSAGTDITLDSNNDFVGAVSASGSMISLFDQNNIILGDIDATGNLEVDAFGSIGDGVVSGAGSDINVAGTTNLNSNSSIIVVTDATNDFGGEVSVSGSTVSLLSLIHI